MRCAAFRTRRARDSAARWRSDRRGAGRGKAAGGGGGAAVRLRTFAIARAPPASTLSLTSAPPTSTLTHLLSLLLCSTHRTGGRPFTTPLETAPRWRWCRRSSRRTRRPPRRRPMYAAPPPLAAWMRGPERSSEVIICNQGQSGVIIRNQRALSGTQRALRGHSEPLGGHSVGPSEAISGPLRGHQRYSEALRGHQRPLRATQRHPVAFRGTQRHSEGPRHAVFTAPRPA
jgi:hypothetical protein